MLCGNTRVRDKSERFFFTNVYELVWIHCEMRGGRLSLRDEECGGGRRMGAHKTYKNKCELPKAATTEGTINCYMEADACIESLLQIIVVVAFRLHAIAILISSVNHHKMHETGSHRDKRIETAIYELKKYRFQKCVSTIRRMVCQLLDYFLHS